MDENEEAGPTVRRTRSAKAAKTPPAAKPVKYKPGPLSRRTRKKVVLMEVEVSDDDDETPQENKSTSDAAEEEKKVEEKLLESPDESNDSISVSAEKGKDPKANKADEGKHELNGNGQNNDSVKSDDTVTVVFNDVEMLEEAEAENNAEDSDANKDNKFIEEKMEVDDEELVEKPALKTVETEESKKLIAKKGTTKTETQKEPEAPSDSSEKEEPKLETPIKEKAKAEVPKNDETVATKQEESKSEKSKKKSEKEPATETTEKEECETSKEDEPKKKSLKKVEAVESVAVKSDKPKIDTLKEVEVILEKPKKAAEKKESGENKPSTAPEAVELKTDSTKKFESESVPKNDESKINLSEKKSMEKDPSKETVDEVKPETKPEKVKPETAPVKAKQESALEKVKPESTPVKVKPESAPKKAKPETTSGVVKPVTAPEKVKPVAAPEKVEPETKVKAETVKPVTTPEKVKTETAPEKVEPEAAPEKVILETAPEKVKPETAPEKVEPETAHEKVKDETVKSVTTPEKVKPETTPEKVKPQSASEDEPKQDVSEEPSKSKKSEQEKPLAEEQKKSELIADEKPKVDDAPKIQKSELVKEEKKEEVKEEPKKEEKNEEGKEEPKKVETGEKKEEAKTEGDVKSEQKSVSDKEKEEIILMEVDETPSAEDKSSKEKLEEEKKDEVAKTVKEEEKKEKPNDAKQKGDPDAENISEDELELPTVVQAAKVPEAEEVSDEELPGPKRAELPADTEVVSEDELPTVKNEGKKEGVKRKLDATDYDPGSPTSENEAPTKKPSLEPSAEKEKEEKSVKPKKLPELDKYWKAVNDDPTDFTGWTYLLQYVDQENDMEAAREAYDAFLSHYPYCYGYWRKYADYEKRKGNKKKCEEVFERGLKAIPLSVDLWIHYLTYVKTTRADDEEFIRSQFERSISACGLEFRSDRLWDSFIKWETEGKRLQRVTAIYDRLLSTPTQGYTSHFDNFQEHIASNPPNKVIEVDEFLALRKEVKHILKHDVTTDNAPDDGDAPPGDDDQSKIVSSDEETKSIRERIVSIRRKLHKATVNAVTARWNYEEGIKRPYFHVKPLERCQLKNWQDYLDYEMAQGDRVRIIVLFERCLIACALYEEFWLKFVHYLEGLKDKELNPKIRDVYERACTIHHLKKPSLHLQWAMFEEEAENPNRAAEVLVNLEKSVPNILQIAYRRINLERRRNDHEKCCQLYEHYINNSKNKMISSNIAIKYSRFCFRAMKNIAKAQEVLKTAITKDPNNPRLYLQLIDLALQKENVSQAEVIEVIDSFLDKESTDIEQKVLFAQRKLEYVEDFGCDVQSVQLAYDQYQKILKQGKDSVKKKETKSEATVSTKKEKPTTQSSSQSSTYNYGTYGNSSAQPSYPYSGSQQQGQNYYQQYGQGNDQYQYQNWQYPQGGYGGYNQWGGYSGGYGY